MTRVIKKFQNPGVIVKSFVLRRRNLSTSASSPILMISVNWQNSVWKLIWSYPDKLRIADSDFYMLDQRNEVYALIAMVAYCQIVDFPTWARMTGWHGGYLGTCLPPATSATGSRALQRKLVVAKDGLDTSALALQCHRDLHFQYTWEKPTPFSN